MFTFKKQERLCKKAAIEDLFSNGRSFFLYPLKIVWITVEEKRKYPARVLINVSKRNFKRAVDRNYLKRIIREAYRKNKHLLYEELNGKQKNLNLAILYSAKEIISYHELEEKIIEALKRLIKTHEKTAN